MNVTKQQFNSNPRAKLLRDISLDITRNLDALLHQDVDKEQAYASIESLSGQLIAAGVVSNMHVGRPQEAFNDPVILAEYVGGQLLESTCNHVTSEREVMPIVQEFSEIQAGNMHVLPTKNLPRPVINFVVMRSVVNVAYRFLDEP